MKIKIPLIHAALKDTGTLFPVFLVVLFLFMSSCDKKESGDTVPPGSVSSIETTPTHGGVILSYKLPDDDDLSYVKAVYTNSLGKEVSRTASYYANSIELEGFNDTLTHTARLYCVDRNDNISEGVEINFTPLVSHIYLVKESISLAPDLGGVKVTWDNIAAKQVFVYLYYENDGKEEERILSSDKEKEAFTVRGLDSLLYNFSVIVEDFEGNKTDKVSRGSLKPLYEEVIDKSTWTVLQSMSVDGDKWEGTLVSFFDDVIDTKDSPDDNSYFIINRDDNGGMLNFPMDIVIDMNKSIVLNRFIIWQRAYWYSDAENQGVSTDYYYYQNENIRSFNVWASNDKSEWTLLGNFDIGDPRDEDGNIPPSAIQEAISGHEFSLENTSDPFRYLKVSVTSNFGSETNTYASEITLYGLDNVITK
ncbi:MAG TPA: DUF4959 domain-containing protein [Bacteroidales bacterium]|nr:DUF4959 domain-containing protein [Bacteroidales bacterium]